MLHGRQHPGSADINHITIVQQGHRRVMSLLALTRKARLFKRKEKKNQFKFFLFNLHEQIPSIVRCDASFFSITDLFCLCHPTP